MTFPRRLLIPDEKVVLDMRPHWVAMILPALVTIAAVIGAWWLLSKIGDTGRWIVLVGLAILLVAYPARRLVWWLTSNFVVTTSRVIHREGFIAKSSMEIPLEAINDVRFEQGIIERVIGAGSLVIQSASESGRNTFSFIRKPEEVQRTIYHQTELNQRRLLHGGPPPTDDAAPEASAGSPSPASPPPPLSPPAATVSPPATPPLGTTAPSVTTELERLADLRSRGILTDEEFEAQKGRILGTEAGTATEPGIPTGASGATDPLPTGDGDGGGEAGSDA